VVLLKGCYSIQAEGFSAKRLEEGYPDWLLDKLPVRKRN